MHGTTSSDAASAAVLVYCNELDPTDYQEGLNRLYPGFTRLIKTPVEAPERVLGNFWFRWHLTGQARKGHRNVIVLCHEGCEPFRRPFCRSQDLTARRERVLRNRYLGVLPRAVIGTTQLLSGYSMQVSTCVLGDSGDLTHVRHFGA